MDLNESIDDEGLRQDFCIENIIRVLALSGIIVPSYAGGDSCYTLDVIMRLC